MSKVNASTEGKAFGIFRRISAVGIVSGVSIAALLLGDLFSSVVNPQSTNMINSEPTVGLMAGIAASFVGMAVGGFTYLVATGRNIEYIDVSRPTRETVKKVGIGVGLSLGLLVLFNVVVVVTGLPVAEGWITDTIGGDLYIALLFVGVVFLFNAPAEEFLFRGIVQKRLSEAFSPWSSILVTSAVFSILHVPAYLMTSTVAETLPPVAVVFGAAVIFGWLYDWSENLFVTIVAHAIFNAVQIGVYILFMFA